MKSKKGTDTHEKVHNEQYVQDTHRYQEIYLYFGYYYCSNGQSDREQEKKHTMIKKNNFNNNNKNAKEKK